MKRWNILCTKGILSKDTVRVFPWETWNQDAMPVIHKDNECRLHFYDKPDMVACIDALSRTNMTRIKLIGNHNDDAETISTSNMTLRNQSKISSGNAIHVSFIGDSRIHQIFINLVLQVNLS